MHPYCSQTVRPDTLISSITTSSWLCRKSSFYRRIHSLARTYAMSATSAAMDTRVAGLAWQMQKLGAPGKSEAGAFTSPFSLYIALALALKGAGKTDVREISLMGT